MSKEDMGKRKAFAARVLREVPAAEISGDRRVKRRYAMNLPVQFKIVRNYLVRSAGAGETIDLSSSGIAFSSPEPLRVGSHIELSIGWPVLLNQSCPLKLVASGRVVRSDGGSTAIRMDRYEFRTQGMKAAVGSTEQAMAVGFIPVTHLN